MLGKCHHENVRLESIPERGVAVLRKILGSIGIGGAKGDTRLGADSFFPGDIVSGEVHITGGGDAQELTRIYLSIVTTYKHDDSTHEYTPANQTSPVASA
jgi:sporulation-control protein spo0M